MEESNFNFSLPIQMRWNDLDALGHVNNSIYVTYFEIARGQFMLKACPDWNWTKDMFLIANVNVDFRKELLLTSVDTRVHVRTIKIGSKSFTLEYQITSKKGDDLIVHATGTTTQIMFDMKLKTTIEIPNNFRLSLSSFDQIEE